MSFYQLVGRRGRLLASGLWDGSRAFGLPIVCNAARLPCLLKRFVWLATMQSSQGNLCRSWKEESGLGRRNNAEEEMGGIDQDMSAKTADFTVEPCLNRKALDHLNACFGLLWLLCRRQSSLRLVTCIIAWMFLSMSRKWEPPPWGNEKSIPALFQTHSIGSDAASHMYQRLIHFHQGGIC